MCKDIHHIDVSTEKYYVIIENFFNSRDFTKITLAVCCNNTPEKTQNVLQALGYMLIQIDGQFEPNYLMDCYQTSNINIISKKKIKKLII